MLTLIVAQARSNAGEPFVALTLFVAVAVFWLAEAWSELIAVRLAGPVTLRGGLRVMAGELPMMGAALLPALALMTRSVGLTTAEQAIDLALAVGLAQLFVWGLAVGRALGRGWTVTLGVAAADVALGLVIVARRCSSSTDARPWSPPNRNGRRSSGARLLSPWVRSVRERALRGPDVPHVRADQPVVGALLDRVGGPAGVPASANVAGNRSGVRPTPMRTGAA